MIPFAFNQMFVQMIDSPLESTRIFWRKKYLNFNDEQSKDPRPAEEIIEELSKILNK